MLPQAVIDDAQAHPERYFGWGQPHNPNMPVGPTNPRRTCLGILTINRAYHPVWNGARWVAFCPPDSHCPPR